jgi:tripartite-type tricarboxylate transporter receptor subunit TctC
MRFGVLICACALGIVIISHQDARGQPYPAKAVRLISPYPPGGGTDATARIIAQALGEQLGQQMIVDSRGGASGRIGTELAAKAPPDGYTLVLGNVAPLAILPGSGMKLSYDAAKDFQPVSLIATSDYILTVHPSLPARSVKELIGLARAKPGALTYATSGVGSPEHFAGEMFKMMTRTDLLAVPYKGGGPIAIDLVAGHVISSFSTMPPIIPHIKANRVRAIAVTTEKRAAVLPDVPTVGETVPGYVMSTWYGAVAPVKTSREIVQRLNQEMVKALAVQEVKEKLAGLGAEVVGTTPEETAAIFRTDLAKYSKVAQAAKIHAD